MVYEFKLPDIGEGVAEGEVLKWMVKEGDTVREDQPLVEVMTDKVNVQIPSPRSGHVTKIMVKEGDVVKVGQVLVAITGEDEDESVQSTARPGSSSTATNADATANVAAGSTTTSTSTTTTTPTPASVQKPQLQSSAQEVASTAGPSERVQATPATRRLAREFGVDITAIVGSGPVGRITEEDVRKAAANRNRSSSPQTLTVQEAPAAGEEERVPLRGIRKAVAERMVKSVHTAAHVTHVDEADLTELVLLREALKGSAEKRGVKLTFLPLIIKAIIPALKDFPYVNSSLDDQRSEIILKKYYNLGVATDTEQGLVVPVLKDADKKNVFELASEIGRLAEKSRAGQLGLEDVRGGTFTISNAGSVGGLFATPIIDWPQVAIIGVHRITKRPVVRDGEIKVREMMYLSLTFDHRVFDGAYAARFLNRVIEIIEDPKKLLSEIL